MGSGQLRIHVITFLSFIPVLQLLVPKSRTMLYYREQNLCGTFDNFLFHNDKKCLLKNIRLSGLKVQKRYPMYDQNGQEQYSFYDQNS